MPTECQDCGHKFYLQGTDLDNVVTGGGCPGCGSHNLYRTQVPPTESEMELRNMVDPATGTDAGGNPLQEGIYADTDSGWAPRDKRDESFASVKTAEFNMDFNFGDDAPQATHKFIVGPNRRIYSLPEPVHHEDIADLHNLHTQGYPTGMDLGILNANGSTTFLQNDSGYAPAQVAESLENHFNLPVTVDPNLQPRTNEQRWNVKPITRGRPLRELERLYGPAKGRSWGTPLDNEGLVRGGSVTDRVLNMEPYVPWAHQADFEDENPVGNPAPSAPSGGTQLQGVTPGPYGIHAGTVRWLQFFDASVDGMNARTDGQEIIRRFGTRQSPEFGRPVTLQVHYPEHLAAAAEAIEMSANGNVPTPKIKEVGAALKAGTIPFPPGMSPENMRGSSIKTAQWQVLLGAAGRGVIGGLMRGALMGTGSHMIQGLLPGQGGQEQQQQQQQPVEPPSPLPPTVMSFYKADLETPSSVPSIGAQGDDPEKVDAHELNDGTQPESFNAGDAGAGGSDGFPPDSEALHEFELLLPKILHYYNLDESAANDPLLRELHHKLEKEQPGYLDHGDDSAAEKLLAALREPSDHITAAGPIGVQPSTGPQPGVMQQPGGFPLQQQPGGPNACPFCGGTRLADGSCPQCGAKATPFGGAIPGAAAPVPGTSQPSFPPVQAASHQGPVNPDQQKAVAELLLEQGRAEEIPHMLEAPWEYANELAQIQNKPDNPPQPQDIPAQPAVEEAPPGATMPMPDPSQQVAAAVARFSADNIAGRCPKCGSATTGVLNEKGDSRCHACGNIWRENKLIKERTSEAHNHAELHKHPVVEGVPAADREQPRDVEQEQDSSLSWQTDDGEPLREGQEYEMHSAKYDVPDIVRITRVKPDGVEFEITGEYDLGHTTEVSKEEADIEGLTFTPVQAADKDDAGEDSSDYLNDVQQTPRQNTVPTPAATTPFTTSVKEADFASDGVPAGFVADKNGEAYDPQFQGDRDLAEETNQHGDFRIGDKWYDGADGDLIPHEAAVEELEFEQELRCPNCTSAHVASQMSSPTSTMHDCYKCGHFWEEHDNDDPGEGDERRAWIMTSGPGDSDEGPAHAYAGLDFVPKQNMKSRNLHEIAAKTAGKKFTPKEQRDLIDEEGEARNRDRLNLEGTHYRVRDDWTGKANGLNAPDEHLVFGL